MAARDLLGGVGRVVVVGGRAEGVDQVGAVVGVAGPTAGLARYGRITDAHDPWGADPGTIGVGWRSPHHEQRADDSGARDDSRQPAMHLVPPGYGTPTPRRLR